MNNGASLLSPSTRFRRPMDVAHWRFLDHVVGESTEVEDAVSTESEYNYETDFGLWRENQQFDFQTIAKSGPPLG